MREKRKSNNLLLIPELSCIQGKVFKHMLKAYALAIQRLTPKETLNQSRMYHH